MSSVEAFPGSPDGSSIEAFLRHQSGIRSLRCSLIQVYYPDLFIATIHNKTPIAVVRSPLLLRPLHFVMRMVLAPPGQRFRHPLKESDLTRFDLKFDYPFLSIYRRNPKKTEIKTWDIVNRRHWSLSGDEVAAALAASFMYPDWIYPNWELNSGPIQRQHLGRSFLLANLRCIVDGGQPIPGGVCKADEIEVSFDLHTGLMVKRVAKLCGNVVEESRLVRVSALAWDR